MRLEDIIYCERKRMEEEAVVAYFKVQSRHSSLTASSRLKFSRSPVIT